VSLQGISSLLQLTQAPQLTSLRLFWISLRTPKFDSESIYWDGQEPSETQVVAAAMSGLLQQLPWLSTLELPGMTLTDAAMQQLGQMQDLQEISMSHRTQIPVGDLSLLPSSVTKLCYISDVADPPNLPPQLPQLSCRLPPGLLGSMTQLQHLQLAGCNLLPAAAPDELEAEGTAALLNVLPQLARLQHLQLSCWTRSALPQSASQH
jgi:hypothetical protein